MKQIEKRKSDHIEIALEEQVCSGYRYWDDVKMTHCALPEVASQLRRAVDDTLNLDNIRTRDLGGTARTEAFTRALVSRINNA